MWHCTGLMSHLDNFVPPIVQLSAINGGAARLHSDAGLKDCREPPTQKGCAVCFIHSDSHVSRRQFIEQFSLGAAAAAAIAGVGTRLAEASEGVAAPGVGTLDLVVAAEGENPPTGGVRTVDGFSKVLHNRFNHDLLAPFHQFTEASELSDPSPGQVPGAIPADQPSNSGAPFVQIFTFNKGQNTGFATFVGHDTGRRAKIPIAPFMGIYGVAPLRKGMYRSVPPNVSGGMGGNTDIKQFVKGSRIQYPVYVKGAKFSVGDGHMAQGDGEVCVTAIETLMSVTCRFKVIKNTIIESPQAIVPAANPTDFGLTKEMLAKGFYHTTGVGPDLMENAKKAVRAMIEWLVRDQGLSLHEAYGICSVAGDLKISEVVDIPNWIVSMTVPRGIFE